MLNKAIKTMETLRKAEETRAALTNEALETLEVLGYESAPGQTRIVINKGHIIEVQTVKEVQVANEEELDRVYEENARHIRRINELAADNEKLIDENMELENQIAFKDGQILGLNRQVKELEAQIEELKDNKLYNIVKEKVEGDDAMEQTETQPKKKSSKLDMIKKLPKTKEFSFKAANEELKAQEQTKEVVEETKEDYKLTWKQMIFDEKVNNYSVTMAAIHGTITIKDKTYKYLAYNYLYYPIVYDCFGEDAKEITQITKEAITKEVDKFHFAPELSKYDVDFKHAQDEVFKLISWGQINKNGRVSYHVCVRTKGNRTVELANDKNKTKDITTITIDNLFKDTPVKWRKINSNSKELANKFMAVCESRWPEDFTNDDNDSKSTKAVKHITKEQQSTTKEEVPQDTNEIVVDFAKDKNVTDITNDENVIDVANDPTADSDDLDI